MKRQQKKKIIKAVIKENKPVAKDHFVIEVKEAYLHKISCPGQFVNIRLSKEVSSEALLRIPLGIHDIKNGQTSFLYKIVGPGTRILSEKKKGDKLDILGPLGRGFDTSSEKKGSKALIVSGGHGVAPLCYLAKNLIHKQVSVDFFIGACAKRHIVGKDEARKIGCKVRLATEDGSCGHEGYVTEALEKYLKQTTDSRQETTVFACGPKPMLKEVARIAKKHKIPAQISLDEYIACGIGACLGCAIKTKSGYKLVCKDGPVFNSEEIVWE